MRDWTFTAALPFWADCGVDRRFGGFVEELGFDGKDAGSEKRTRVTARQMYVFSHAHLLGWSDGFSLIERGGEFLIERTWLGKDKGFARTLTRESAVADPTPDLYDHAFTLFAFAWAYRATHNGLYLEWAHTTLDFIETNLGHPGGEGFESQRPPQGWRRQNPHMHLLEALLAAYEASGERRFSEQARSLAALFSLRFYDAEAGVLREFFTEEWSRAPGEPGAVVEPGHHFEWTWLLGRCERLLGLKFPREMQALSAFAERHGINRETGAVRMAVRDDGTVLDDVSRTWPNTERLKAALALFERDGTDPVPVINQTGRLLFERHFSSAPGIALPAGAWIDAFDGKGRALSRTIPASTLYHVFLAFNEVMRVANTTAG
jgi:N-acylglucosamine 2-epimerase/mannose-6-phosphate isomerase